jgi:WhiB family transcriptional regulator, redox-sensing transcriptional regulator
VTRRWRDGALCTQTDPEVFFPARGQSSATAKAICRRCEVKADCLEHAVRTGEQHGVWGASTDAERRRIRRR